MAILREAGIEVDSVRGTYGGYRLGRGIRLPPLMFSAVEALGLVMAALDGHHDVNDPGDPVGSALGKLVRALPPAVAAQAAAVRTNAAPVPDRGAARPDPGRTAALVDACAQRRKVTITYRPESGPAWETAVEPWAVVVRHGRWYLLCRRSDGATRAYRVDRVHEVVPLSTSFVPPGDLDAAGMLEDHLAVGWRHVTEVLIAAPVELVRRCLPRALGRLEGVDEETTRLVGSTNEPSWYAEQLAVVPAPFTIVGGPELREAVALLGRRYADAISGRSSTTGRPPAR